MPTYLGVVTLGLLAYAAACRVRFERAGYWWTCFAMLVVLSLGASATIGGRQRLLPGYFLRKHLLILDPIRVPRGSACARRSSGRCWPRRG